MEPNPRMTDSPNPSSTPTGDRVVLELPASAELRGVASLVLGGIGSRIDLPYEKVDELQLAVLTLLGASEIESATIEIVIGDSAVFVKVGPLPLGTSSALGLQTVLERLVDTVELARSDDGSDTEWMSLELAHPRAAL